MWLGMMLGIWVGGTIGFVFGTLMGLKEEQMWRRMVENLTKQLAQMQEAQQPCTLTACHCAPATPTEGS